MRLSILNQSNTVAIDSSILNDLLIHRLARYMTPKVDVQSFTLQVLRSLQCDIEVIENRQNTAREFIENRELFDEFSSLVDKFTTIRKEWVNTHNASFSQKNKTVHTRNVVTDLNYLIYFKNIVKIILKLLDNYEQIVKCLDKYKAKSPFLLNIKSYIIEKIEKEEYKAFKKELIKYSELDENETSYDFVVYFDRQFKIVDAAMQGLDDGGRGFSVINALGRIFKGKDEDRYELMEITLTNKNYMSDILSLAFKDVIFALESIIRQLYDPFNDIAGELKFYEFSLLLWERFKSCDIEFDFPKVVRPEEDVFCCKGLYDAFLLLNAIDTFGVSTIKVTPYDVDMNKDVGALVVKGENNTGKTVLLRSIGIAQILAQAGLPIPAKSAVISIRNTIVTHFSSKETNISRFEEEVKQISEIFDSIKENSMVLLNETFQSTAFDEAKYGLYDVIYALTKINCKTVLVTYIVELFDMLDELEKEIGGGKKIVGIKMGNENGKYTIAQVH